MIDLRKKVIIKVAMGSKYNPVKLASFICVLDVISG